MPIAWQRVLPVVVSILIIIAVAILRQYSRTFAAIAATMPINIPLALWIVHSGAPADRAGLLSFFETVIVGFPPTFVFIVVAYLAARAGWDLLPMLLAGYAAWGISLALMLPLRSLFFG